MQKAALRCELVGPSRRGVNKPDNVLFQDVVPWWRSTRTAREACLLLIERPFRRHTDYGSYGSSHNCSSLACNKTAVANALPAIAKSIAFI